MPDPGDHDAAIQVVTMRGLRNRIHRRPKDIIKPLKAALDELLYMKTMGVSRPSSLQAFRPDDQGPWTMQLTTRRGFLLDSEKIIHLSSTSVPERVRLLYGEPTRSAKWVVYKANLKRKEKRVMVADRSFSRRSLLGKRAEPLRKKFFETIDALIEQEKKRTGLPVALIGASAVVNAYLKHRLGNAANDYTMPFKGHEREDKMKGLRDFTEQLGFLAGYAHGVAGSNDFCVEQDGQTQFVRSLVVLGNCYPT